MGAEGMVSFIAIVVLLFPLAAAMISESHRDAQQLPLGNPCNLEGSVDEESAELLWVNCGAEFTHLVGAHQDLQSSSIDKPPLEKERLSTAFTVQDPDVKRTVVDCLRDVEDRNIRKWYGQCLDPFLPRASGTPIRRRLAEKKAPNPLPSPVSDPEAGYSEEYDHSSSVEDIEPIPFTVSKADTGGGGISSVTIIIAVVSTATVTFLLASLFFCWYTRTYGGVQTDEKPLLSLSRNASIKSTYAGKDSGNGGDQPLGTNSDIKKSGSTVHSSVSLGIASEPPPGIPLKPPPGRPELALKVPPGRADPSVHSPLLNTASSTPPSPAPAAAPAMAPPPSPSQSPSPSPAPAAAPFPPARVPSARRPAAPPPPPSKGAPPPPPPVKKGPDPPPPPDGGKAPPRPPGVGLRAPRHASGPGQPGADDSNKTKLKPFFWDKVNMANPDQAMVWHQIKAGSFQFNEEMIENLFGYSAADKNKGNNKKTPTQDPNSQFVQILDPKKAQNLSILLKALSVTVNEVCDALKEGNELPVELIQTLLKMAPTGEEELKLRLYNGDPSRLGTAERFLKKLVEIPFAYKRLESLLFMCTLQEEVDIIKESFQTLEAACIELKKSRLFLKLLEAVLKTGNRMNDGTFRGSAQAFKLDTLLKLSDVKGVDGKTTLLHFVVLEIIRAEGVRAAKTAREAKNSPSFKTDDVLEEAANSTQDSDEYYRNLGLHVVSRLSSELEDVKKAAVLDADGLTGTVSKFGHALVKAREFLNTDLKNLEENKDEDDDDDEDEFPEILANFVKNAEKDVMWMLEEEKRIMTIVKNTADYFHGQAGKDEGLRLFVIIRDFLIILDKVCKEIKSTPLVPPKTTQTKDVSSSKTTETKDSPASKMTETKDSSSPMKTEMKDASSSMKMETEERKDVSSPRTTETKDVSEHRTPQAKDVSLPKSTERKHVPEPSTPQTKDVSSPRTEEIGDLQHETHETEYAHHGTREIVDSATQEAEDSRHETRKMDGLLHGKLEHDQWEPRTDKDDDLRHETLEPGDSQSMMQEDDDPSQPRKWETDDLRHETQKTDDLQYERQETYDSRNELKEADHSAPETREDDDSGPETQEEDDSGPKTQESDNSGPETHEDDDSWPKIQEPDESQPKEQEDDDLQPKTQEKDDSPQEDDDLQPETEKKDVRLDSLNSNSSSDED